MDCHVVLRTPRNDVRGEIVTHSELMTEHVGLSNMSVINRLAFFLDCHADFISSQ
ncbi:MAG: hypothetical protein LBT96_03245 [Campylobacteraceae bacterium]|nr:hypothetical protein [Campylobacteraceae bacterium]